MKLDFFSTLDILLFSPKIINYYYFINLIIIMLAIFGIIIFKHFNKKELSIIIINIVFEIIFNYYLVNNNPYLLFSSKLIQFIFSIHLNEIIYINKKSAKLLLPYIIWNYLLTLFATVYLFLNISI